MAQTVNPPGTAENARYFEALRSKPPRTRRPGQYVRHLVDDYEAEYERLFEEQNGKCGICGREPTKRALVMDHCHRTEKIRGLLCINCNAQLAFVEKYLRPIAVYLRKYR